MHFSNVFGIDFYWINDQRLYTLDVYVTRLHSLLVPPKKIKDHPSITYGHWECQEISRISRAVRDKKSSSLAPGEVASQLDIGWWEDGKTTKWPPGYLHPFAMIFSSKHTPIGRPPFHCFLCMFFLSLHPQNPFLLTLECNTCTYVGESYEWYDIWHITTPYAQVI